MKLKYFILAFLFGGLLLTPSALQAQKTRLNLQEHDYNPYHFGFFVAVNQMDFSIKSNDNLIGVIYDPANYSDFVGTNHVQFYGVFSEPSMGFTVGIIGNLKINKYLDLRFIPSLSFGERTLSYSIMKHYDASDPEMVLLKKSIVSTHVDFPFHIKYKSKRLNNLRAYILGGVKISIDMAANSDKNQQQNEDLLRLKQTDLLFETGVGFDYYFDFFKFGLELKVAYGLNNLIATEGNMFADALKGIHSKTIQLSLTFE